MQLRLTSSVAPCGRCATLAKGIYSVTSADPQWCIRMAESLFDGRHYPGNPAILQVANPGAIGQLQAICEEVGIAILIEE